jgi:hypothetical protein
VLARGRVEERRGLGGRGDRVELVLERLRELVDQNGLRRRRVSDHVRVGLGSVDGRLVGEMVAVGDGRRRRVDRRVADGADRAARGDRGLARDVRRALEHGAEGGSRQEERAGPAEEEAEDERPRTAEQAAEDGVEPVSDGPAPLLAEQHHGADAEEDEARSEGLDVHEGRAGNHERAEHDEHDRHADARRAEELVEPVGDRRPDDPAVPLEPGDEREEEPAAEKAQPQELVMVMSSLLAGALLLAHAGGRPRAYPRRTLLLRHVPAVRGRPPPSSSRSGAVERLDSLAEQLEEAVPVDPDADVGVRLVARPAPQIDDRAAAAELRLAVHVDMAVEGLDDPRP